MLTAIVIASLAGLLAGAGGTLAVTSRGRTNRHDAQVATAQADQVQAAAQAGADAVTAALEPAMSRVDTLAALAQALPPYCQPGDDYSESACVMDRVCSRATVDGGVSARGCDVAGNEWVSERQLAVIEGGGVDEDLRTERRALFARRK